MGKRFPLVSNKIKSKARITFTENENIISSGKKVAKTFRKIFSDIVKTLNISKNTYFVSETSQTDPVLQSIEKFSKYPKTLNIKNRMSNLNFAFCFEIKTKEIFSKLIQNLNANKATQQYDIPINILK